MRTLPLRLLDTAERRPHACAVQRGPARSSYGELAGRSSRLARWLVARRLRAGDRVAILAEASANYVESYYGTLLAGCAVVALNAAARAEDLAGWIRHAECSLVILDAAHAEAAPLLARLDPDMPVLAWHADGLAHPHLDFEAAVQGDVAARLPRLDPDGLAALMYTSGTTGRPKAVMLSHRNLASNADSIVTYLRLASDDSIACVLPFYYSYGSSILHTHVTVGARIVLQPNLVYPHALLEAMSHEAVTGFAGVPSTFALLTSRVPLDRYDLSALRYVTQAGGPMSPALTARVRQMLPHARLYVMYGQTEAAARLTYLPPERLTDKSGSVGIAIPDVELQVRTEHGEIAPPGSAGEVWARGPNVMLGYWRDPLATRAVLVDGWLRTGDAGWMDAEGFLYLQGRRSDIIKVGAHRIHPRDIEAVIEELPEVAEVAVVGADDELLGQVVRACIVRRPGTLLDATAVKAHCRARLATYKIPKLVEFVAALPRTSSGKLRRQLLAHSPSP